MSTNAEEEKLFPRPLSGDIVPELPSALIPARHNLVGTSVTLEPQDASKHSRELYEAGHNSKEALRIWDYLTYGPWPDEAAYKTLLRQQSSSFDPVFYAIRCHKSGKVCGQASFLDINAQNGVIEIGHIWFGPQLQRTKGATEALYLMIKYAMDELGYRRMPWRCNGMNEKSRQAARRLGFRFEGIFYNHLIFKGKNRDTTWYSILDNEWPEVRTIMENWLSDENFDSGGTSKTSLFKLMQDRSKSVRGPAGERQ